MKRVDIMQWFLDSLLKMNVIKSFDEVLDSKVVDVKYAYPVPTHNRRVIMETASEYLADYQIHSLGRFGEWAYINSDESLARGLILGETLAGK
jgi:hypothetical protein